jgi:LysM repeat protein
MKIMKVLGVVVGIHVFALILIFANPGCSSTTQPSPAPIDTVAKNEPAPSVTATGVSPSVNVPSGNSPMSAAPAFNPDAPALAASTGGAPGIRFTPTRPNTSAAATLLAEPVADVIPATTYAVKSGDSLWTIAKKNNLTVADLAAANNLQSTSALHEGQKLIIPAKKASPAAAASAAMSSSTAATSAKPAEMSGTKAPAESVKHTVKSGESLSMIAKQYGVKQGDIAVANNITDPQKIRAGMQLVIPGWQSTTGKSAAAAAKPATIKPGSSPASAPAKPAVPEIKPLFNAPVIAPGSAPATTSEVPVIKVDEAPADSKPKS